MAKSPIQKTTEVKVAIAEQKVFEHRIHAKGKVVALRQAELRFQQAALLEQVAVKNNAWVKQGQLLARQQTQPLKIALAKAEQEILKTTNQYLARACDFNFCLEDTANIPADKKAQLMAQTGLAQALIQKQEAKWNLKQASLLAPFSGRIANLEQQNHQITDVSRPFCTLYDPNSLAIEILVMESDYQQIQQGLKADVFLIGTTKKAIKAILVETNPLVNEQGMIKLRLKLQSSKGVLPGMNATVELRIPQQQQVVVPKEAVVIRSGKAVVFTLKEGHAYWNYVTPGAENAKEQAILEGIQPNAKVIITNNLQLAHDAPVVEEGS